jgi:hypothetical protein
MHELEPHAIQEFAGRRDTLPSPDCRLLASDGEADHLHLKYPPKLSVSVLVNAGHVKSGASQEPTKHHLARSRRCVVVAGRFGCVGQRLAIIKQYVEQPRQRASCSP